MARKTVMLTANADCKLKEFGARIKRARLRRNMSVESLSEKAGIGENTFYAIERGASTVSIGAYVAVLVVLGIDSDIDMIATDEEFIVILTVALLIVAILDMKNHKK